VAGRSAVCRTGGTRIFVDQLNPRRPSLAYHRLAQGDDTLVEDFSGIDDHFRSDQDAGTKAGKRRAGARERHPIAPSRLTGQSCAHRSRRRASLAVAIIQRVLIDQAEDISSFIIRYHHQFAAGCESAPQRLILVAGWIGALEATNKGIALLLGYDQGRKAAAPSLNLGNSVPLASPRADKGD